MLCFHLLTLWNGSYYWSDVLLESSDHVELNRQLREDCCASYSVAFLLPKPRCGKIFETGEQDWATPLCYCTSWSMHVVLSEWQLDNPNCCCCCTNVLSWNINLSLGTCCYENNPSRPFLLHCHSKTSFLWLSFTEGFLEHGITALATQQEGNKKWSQVILALLVPRDRTSQDNDVFRRQLTRPNKRLLRYKRDQCLLFIESHSIFCSSLSLFLSTSA